MKARTKFAILLVSTLVSAPYIPGQGAPERVIVTFTAGTDLAAAAKSATAFGAVITHVLSQGYSGILPGRLIAQLRSQPNVSNIETDQLVWVAQQQCVVQSPAPDWGLNRICHRGQPISENEYVYQRDGTGVNVYVLDTGIDTSNSDFGGRATWGADEIDGAKQDCNGHGTAMAGTIGGLKYGVAKNVSLTSVRVMSCLGVAFDSDVVAGLEWATGNYISNGKKPSVAVLGFSGPFSKALNAAVNAAYNSGLGSIVAAGNERADACQYSPSSAAGVISVAASDITDNRAWFSNGGSCAGVFAPGVNIPSDWLHGQTASFSGTSMSAAFVAGVAALILNEHRTWTFDQVTNHINATATKGVINETPGGCNDKALPPFRCAPLSPNALVFSACDV